MTSDGGFEYFAFISYKREDERWAKWLQRKLESYSLPTTLRKENPGLPDRIRPVFRDQSDLSGGNLRAEIEKGLNGSKYLIVICSPRSANSPWVSKEVSHFIDRGRGDDIIPFIIGGTPNSSDPDDECFPEGLRRLSGERELLGININEMGRDAAAIKVIARMFGLRFDSLWQRHEKAKRRRVAVITGIILSLLIAAVAVTAVLWDKNLTINNQNERLTTLVKNLREENKTFSQMRTESERYSFVGSLRGNNARNDALHVSYHPYEPIVAFSDDWGYWLHYVRGNVEICLPVDDEPDCVLNTEGPTFSTDGTELLSSSWGGIFVWDVASHRLIKHLPFDFDVLERITSDGYDFRQDDIEAFDIDSLNRLFPNRFSYADSVIVARSGSASSSTVIPESEYYSLSVHYNKRFDELLFVGDRRAALYDISGNDFVQFFKGYDSADFSFSPSGEYLRIGKDLFARNVHPDTISDLPFKRIEKIAGRMPDTTVSRSNPLNIRISDNTILYNFQNKARKIEVIRNSNMGNGQEYLLDAVFVSPDKIIAIVEQGDHRVYNALTGELSGTLVSSVWMGGIGHEQDLSHAESGIAHVKVIGRDLYVVSSGGILRIYDIDKIRLKRLIMLPIEPDAEQRIGAIDHCTIADDGSRIEYSFDGNTFSYSCKLPFL